MTQTWLSYHFYPLETPDVFLTRALRPFLEQYIWPTKGARAFFVRYDDERGPHIRLRLRGEAEWVEDTLRPAVEGLPAEASEMEGLPAEASAKAGGSTQTQDFYEKKIRTMQFFFRYELPHAAACAKTLTVDF